MTEHSLVILRHAKADRPTEVADAARPLTERGRADATAAGQWLASQGYHPDLVLCSPATRTRQTWHGVAGGLTEPLAENPESRTEALTGPSSRQNDHLAPNVRYEQRLYAATSADLLEVLRDVPAETGVLLLVGHNPAVSELSILLTPGRKWSPDVVAHQSAAGMRTAGIVVHQVPGDWSSLDLDSASIIGAHTARG